jgi:hypothetical protein
MILLSFFRVCAKKNGARNAEPRLQKKNCRRKIYSLITNLPLLITSPFLSLMI